MGKQSKALSLAIVSMIAVALCGCAGCFKSESNINKETKVNPIYKSVMIEDMLTNVDTRPTERAHDARFIAAKYLPIGSSREQVEKVLTEMQVDHTTRGNKIDIFVEFVPPPSFMIPNRGVSIFLKFDAQNNLHKIDGSYLYTMGR